MNVEPTEAGARAADRRMYALLMGAFAAMAASMTLFEINFPNYLSEAYQVTAGFRGFLEFPRESQGFAVVLYLVVLGGLTEGRLFAVSAAAAALGLLGLAMIEPTVIADDPDAIAPRGGMILLVMLHSAGFHVSGVMQRAIILDRGKLSEAGKRLGQVGFWATVAMLLSAAAAWALRETTDVTFQQFFVAAGLLACAGSVLMVVALRGQPGIRHERRRFVLKKKFARYYALCALFGVRKQVFITFAAWVLVKIYDQPAETFAKLWVVTSLANLALKPLIGKLIDRFGPRRMLVADALILCVICYLYGYAKFLLPPTWALLLVGALYVLDHIMFFVGAARSVYVSSIADNTDEVTATLSLGMTIDHIFSMSVPFLGGLLWQACGYQYVFVAAGAVALVTAMASYGMPRDLHLPDAKSA